MGWAGLWLSGIHLSIHPSIHPIHEPSFPLHTCTIYPSTSSSHTITTPVFFPFHNHDKHQKQMQMQVSNGSPYLSPSPRLPPPP